MPEHIYPKTHDSILRFLYREIGEKNYRWRGGPFSFIANVYTRNTWHGFGEQHLAEIIGLENSGGKIYVKDPDFWLYIQRFVDEWEMQSGHAVTVVHPKQHKSIAYPSINREANND